MKKYAVIGLMARFNAGQKLQLRPEQVKPRLESGAIRFIKGDIYEVVTGVEFKRGEEVGFDGEISKAQLQEIEPAGAKAPKIKGRRADKAQDAAEKEPDKTEVSGDADDDDDITDESQSDAAEPRGVPLILK